MTKKETVKAGNVLKFAGAFIAFLIGAGFATGQEILQYFTSYGFAGLLTAAVMLVLFLYVSVDFVTVGYTQNLKKGSDVFGYYCGKYVGYFYDYFTILVVSLSYVVMIGGAGSTLAQRYGLPTYVGGIIMMSLAAVTVVFGLGKIVDVIGKIGPFIVFIAVGLGLFAIIYNPSGIAEGNKLIAEGKLVEGKFIIDGGLEVLRAGTNWFISASSYVGFCMLWLAAFLAAMAKQANSLKEARIGVSLGAIGFTLGCVIFMLGLLAYLKGVTAPKVQIPSLVLADKIHPSISSVFAVVILAAIYTTAVPLLWQVSARFAEEKTKKFTIITVVVAAVGCFIGVALPFKKLVNVIYVINGYVGILLIFFMVVSTARRMLKKANCGKRA